MKQEIEPETNNKKKQKRQKNDETSAEELEADEEGKSVLSLFFSAQY